jgi:hypothetical protein
MTTKRERAGAAASAPKKKTKAQLVAERRKIRDDLGSHASVLGFPEGHPELQFRWVNDVVTKFGTSRVADLQAKGWQVWTGEGPTEGDNKSLGSGGDREVGLDGKGNPIRALLMYIPKEVYEIDQYLKEEALREKEKAITGETEQPGHYGNISIGQKD